MRIDYVEPYRYYRIDRIRKLINIILVNTVIIFLIIATFAYKSKNQDLVKTNLSVDTLLKQEQLLHQEALRPKLDPEPSWQTVTINSGDTLEKIFTKLGLSIATLHELIDKNPEKQNITKLIPGQKIEFLLSINKELKALRFPRSKVKTLEINNIQDGYKYIYNTNQIIKKITYHTNFIKDSLFVSGQTIGLDDAIIMQLVNIFGCEIDFAFDIRENDSFKLLLEEEYVNDQKINSGNILMAEFKSKNKTYKAIRYTDPQGNTRYYSPEGNRMQKVFLRTPVEFTRISSRFSNGRYHPILHKIRAHRGVDYAAPVGTPIKAAADGRIAFLGKQNGYGKAIELNHGSTYSTFYAHLSAFAANVKQGSYIKQGQIIGFVGKTGLASGSHLHYEFRINGIHHDPLKVTFPKSLSIEKKFKNKFFNHAQQITNLLKEYEGQTLAKNE